MSQMPSECMRQLETLMDEYNDLERTEEKLMVMLEQVRREEGCMVRALNDEIVTTNSSSGELSGIGSIRTEPIERNLDRKLNPPEQNPSKNDKNQSRKLSPLEGGQAAGKLQQERALLREQNIPIEVSTMDNEKAIHPETTSIKRPAKRYKLGRARASLDRSTKQHNKRSVAPQSKLEANKRAQQREEQIIARQRLEDALFADDDDDDSSSSSSS